MGMFPDALTPLFERALAHQQLRHTVIASNIANANTPGFTAFDVVLRSRLADAPLEPIRTDPRHLSASAELDSIGAQVIRSHAPARVDGNNVSLEQELIRMTENRMRYQATVELMERWGVMKRYARETR